VSAPVKIPANIQPYVRVLGEDMTIEFLLEFGGAELYLAREPKGRGRVEKLVGRDKAAALARASESMQKRIPLAKRWLAEVLQARGLSNADIARKMRVTDVTVRHYHKERAERQMEMPV
jgi:ribosome-binding protein aMBF1 (putative translation factor)